MFIHASFPKQLKQIQTFPQTDDRCKKTTHFESPGDWERTQLLHLHDRYDQGTWKGRSLARLVSQPLSKTFSPKVHRFPWRQTVQLLSFNRNRSEFIWIILNYDVIDLNFYENLGFMMVYVNSSFTSTTVPFARLLVAHLAAPVRRGAPLQGGAALRAEAFAEEGVHGLLADLLGAGDVWKIKFKKVMDFGLHKSRSISSGFWTFVGHVFTTLAYFVWFLWCNMVETYFESCVCWQKLVPPLLFDYYWVFRCCQKTTRVWPIFRVCKPANCDWIGIHWKKHPQVLKITQKIKDGNMT